MNNYKVSYRYTDSEGRICEQPMGTYKAANPGAAKTLALMHHVPNDPDQRAVMRPSLVATVQQTENVLA